MTVFRVIRQHEPGELTSIYEVWAGHINADTDGFSGHVIATCGTAAQAYALAGRLNGDPSQPGCDHIPF